MLVANFSISKFAEPVFSDQVGGLRLGRGEIAGMVYVEYFREENGDSVKGFVPGYQLGSWKKDYIGAEWINIRIGNEFDFYLLPKFRWNARNHYLVDNAGGSYALFSIKRIT